MVVKEAMALANGTLTFEEAPAVEISVPKPTTDDDAPAPPMEDELDEPASPPQQQNHNGRLENGNRPSWWSANYKLAKQYLHGDVDKGIAQDFVQARKLLLSESEQNNALAMCDLGRMYADGLGIEPDADTAHQWYKQALAVFHATESAKPWKYTEYRIGKMYAAGLGTDHKVNCPEGAREGGLGRDYETAAHWLTLSANQDYKYAEYSLDGLYCRGNGV